MIFVQSYYLCIKFLTQMIEILLILAAGIALGRIGAKLRLTARIGGAVKWTVCALVAVLGYSIGADSTLAGELPEIGLTGISLAVAGTAGSIIGAMILTRLTGRKGGGE